MVASEEDIPVGTRCYAITGIDKETGRITKKMCPHWSETHDRGIATAHCSFLKMKSEDLNQRNLLWDCVKQCKVNER